MTTALAPALPVQTGLTTLSREQIELVKRTVARGATDDELKLFVHVANKAGLDPFAKQVYAIKRGANMTIQTGIDGFRLIAARTGLHAGTDEAIIEEDEQGRPLKATVTVYKIVGGQRVPFSATARMAEYNAGQGLWNKMPFAMLSKCAEALALRKAFPADLSGIYANEEMAQADAPVARTMAPPAAQDDPDMAERAALLKALREPSISSEVKKAATALGLAGKKPADLTTAQLKALHDTALPVGDAFVEAAEPREPGQD